MKSDTTAQAAKKKGKEQFLAISVHAVPSKLQVGGGAEIPFSRAVLSIRNTGAQAVVGVVPHATLAQEGGTVHDATEALSQARTVESIAPGEAVEWDVYDLLLAADAGVASKVHLFGYKAVMNWWFTVSAWAEYRLPDGTAPLRTPTARWKLRWSAAKTSPDEVELTIAGVEG